MEVNETRNCLSIYIYLNGQEADLKLFSCGFLIPEVKMNFMFLIII